jgi:NAD(P)-dependent dehydrogenase (short-subunit alcohol dehydrogenase family)
MPNSSVCGATKRALLIFAKTISGKSISRGIRVNAISGGPIATSLYAKLGMGDEQRKSLAVRFPPDERGNLWKLLRLSFSLPLTNPRSRSTANWSSTTA